MLNPFVFTRTVAIALMVCSFACAQEYKPTARIGVHGAPSFCTYYSIHNPMYLKNDYHPGIGYIAGISMQADFSPRLSFRFETNYEQLGYSYEQLHRPGFLIAFITRSVRASCISLPLSFNYRFLNRGKTNLFLNIGNYWNYTFSERFRDELPTGEKERYTRTDYKRLGIGLLAGLGVTRKMTNQLQLTVELRDQFTVIDDINATLGSRRYPTDKNNALGLLIGLQFSFGNQQNERI